jgi:trehalose synthase
MREIEIAPLSLDQLASLLTEARARRLMEYAVRGREQLQGKVVWNVNATAQGGGVAEMLQSTLAYARGAGVDTRWLVLTGNPQFFAVTKRIHNLVHGQTGDGGPLGEDEATLFRHALDTNLDVMVPLVKPGDIVLLHDPQTAGMVDRLRAAGAHVAWRSHIGRDVPNEHTARAWRFLRPMVENADAFVFSRLSYAPEWIPADHLMVIPPSIDPFSAKNRELAEVDIRAAITHAGLVAGSVEEDALLFPRRDGSVGRVRAHTELVVDGSPPPLDARIVMQVSRWDLLKDMSGVLRAFADRLDDLPDDVHLMLVGPDVAGVTDDPEGALVLAQCRELKAALDPVRRERVHLVVLPMDDVDENAHLVNALQRHASVIVQKSFEEGFGLTVTEAMWKARPLVASAVGGIQDQIIDGEHGLLLKDPHDAGLLHKALHRVLTDDRLAEDLGRGAQARVRDHYLGDRHLAQYVDLFAMMLKA